MGRKPGAGTAHAGVSSHQSYSPSGDTSPEAPSPEVGSGIRNVPIVYPSGAAEPYASYSSNSSTSASTPSSSSSHRATYIPYSSLASSHSKAVTVASVPSAVFDDVDIDAQCLAELEAVEKTYFEKKQREKQRGKEMEMNRDREGDGDSVYDDQTTQPTQQQWSPTEVACNDQDMQIEPSHESEPHSQDTADADDDAGDNTDTHSDENDQPHSQEE